MPRQFSVVDEDLDEEVDNLVIKRFRLSKPERRWSRYDRRPKIIETPG